MAYCPSCGTQVDGAFCAKCGTPVAAAAGGGYAPPPATPIQASGMADNVASALCYLFGLFTGILFLVLEPYNKSKLIRFHAFQAIFMHLALIVVFFAISIFFSVIIHIPILGALVGMALWPIVGFAAMAVWIMLMYKAYNNQKWVLPIIGPLAEKQA